MEHIGSNQCCCRFDEYDFIDNSYISKMKPYRLCFILIIGVVGSFVWKKSTPRLFLIGDSISIHYEPFLKGQLKNSIVLESRKDLSEAEANLDVPKGRNGGDSNMVLRYLQAKLSDSLFRPDYIMLNCGLHDIKRLVTDNAYQVDSFTYRKNLEAICVLADARRIPLIWVNSTPVLDTVHNNRSKKFHRFSSDIKRYNEIANQVFRSHDVPVIDLHSFTESLGREAVIDHVHYSPEGRAQQAAFLSEHIRRLVLNQQ